MKTEDFYTLIQLFLEECVETMKTKGKAYAGKDQSIFANFNRVAAKKRIPRQVVASIYMDKHLDALDSFIRGEYGDPEPIEGRIKDVINYLLLLYGMIMEQQMAIPAPDAPNKSFVRFHPSGTQKSLK